MAILVTICIIHPNDFVQTSSVILKLLDDVHNDTRWSPDILDVLKVVCSVTKSHYLKPPKATEHRWLSSLNAADAIYPMLDPLKLLYLGFMPKTRKTGDEGIIKRMYKKEYKQIIKDNNVEAVGKTLIKEKIDEISRKGLTEDGMNRKERIYDKLWGSSDYTKLVMQQYRLVLPMFKSFTLVFERKTPQVHLLHSKLCEVFRQFLSSFVHHDILNKCTTAKQLKSLDITDDIIRPKGDLFYGAKNERLMNEMKKEKKNDIVLQFQSEVVISIVPSTCKVSWHWKTMS